MYNESESHFDAIVRRTGNSFVITVPKESILKLGLAENSGVSINLKKWVKSN